LAESSEHHESHDARPAKDSELQRRHEQQRVNRHEDADCGEDADQQLDRGADIFQRFALNRGARPHKSPHVGEEPEPVDAERDRLEGAADHQPPIRATSTDEAEPCRPRREAMGHLAPQSARSQQDRQRSCFTAS
jgi:hypothetical protein